MEKENNRKAGKNIFVGFFSFAYFCLFICGCSLLEGYSNEPLFPEDIRSVYVEMFDSQSSYRGVEWELSDSIAKRIESQCGYKVIDDRSRADSVISGFIESIGQGALAIERETGRSVETEINLAATFNWKNLKTGELLVENETISVSSSYTEWQNFGFNYGSSLAVNKLAQRIVEAMEKEWK